MESIKLKATSRLRIDRFVSNETGYSRRIVENWIEGGQVLAAGKRVLKNHILSIGECVTVTVPPILELDLVPTPMNLDILYEDEDLLVLNKPKGLVVHPAPGNREETLVNGLLDYNPHLSTINGKYRPGIVHRIDKDTSGLLVIAKTDEAHHHLTEQFAIHNISRRYKALVLGDIHESTGEIRLPIGRDPKSRVKMAVVSGGKSAVTRYRVLEHFKSHALVECTLETGRTHQIRVHMAYLKHPVAGDPMYGHNTPLIRTTGQYLHAFHLGFVHPTTGEMMSFDAPLPEYFQTMLETLRREDM